MDDQKLARLISDALFCHHAGEYGRELELWLEVQAAKPGPEWQHNIALALMNNGRYFEALEMFEKLASLNPQLSRVHNNRAALLVLMGLDLQFVVPVLLQGLTNPEDMTELVRHFVNVCGTIALGFDDRQDEAFDLVAKISAEGLERHSPPDLLEKNKDTFLNMLSAYRRTAAYREALAQGKWQRPSSKVWGWITSLAAFPPQQGTLNYVEIHSRCWNDLEAARNFQRTKSGMRTRDC